METAILKLTSPHPLEIEYYIEGVGETLVYLCGAGTKFQANEKFFKPLEKKFKLITFNYPGFGKSTPLEHVSVSNYRLVVENVIDTLGLNGFYLCGQSFGGFLAMEYTQQHPNKIKGLILTSPYVRPKDRRLVGSFVNIIRDEIDDEFGDKSDGLGEGLVSSKYFNDPRELVRQGEMVLAINVDLAVYKFEKPTLVILGERDRVIDSDYSAELFSKMHNVTLKVYPEVGHNAYVFIDDLPAVFEEFVSHTKGKFSLFKYIQSKLKLI